MSGLSDFEMISLQQIVRVGTWAPTCTCSRFNQSVTVSRSYDFGAFFIISFRPKYRACMSHSIRSQRRLHVLCKLSYDGKSTAACRPQAQKQNFGKAAGATQHCCPQAHLAPGAALKRPTENFCLPHVQSSRRLSKRQSPCNHSIPFANTRAKDQ